VTRSMNAAIIETQRGQSLRGGVQCSSVQYADRLSESDFACFTSRIPTDVMNPLLAVRPTTCMGMSLEEGNILISPTIRSRMSDATLDDRGRLTLPKGLRERYGDHYHIVEFQDGIKLIPIAENPLEALRDEFEDVEKTADELREEERDAALDEAGR